MEPQDSGEAAWTNQDVIFAVLKNDIPE